METDVLVPASLAGDALGELNVVGAEVHPVHAMAELLRDPEGRPAAPRACIHATRPRRKAVECLQDQIDLLGLHTVQLTLDELISHSRRSIQNAAVEVADAVVEVVKIVLLPGEQVDVVSRLVVPVLTLLTVVVAKYRRIGQGGVLRVHDGFFAVHIRVGVGQIRSVAMSR